MDNEIFEQLLKHYKSVFNTPSGERCLKDLRIYVTQINRLEPDPNAALFRAGQQSIIDRIEKMRNIEPKEK